MDVYAPQFCLDCQTKITPEIESDYATNEFEKIVEILCETCTNMFDSMLEDVSINPRMSGDGDVTVRISRNYQRKRKKVRDDLSPSSI
jgi:hypothetical protein